MDKKRKMQENHNLEDIGKAIEKGMNNVDRKSVV